MKTLFRRIQVEMDSLKQTRDVIVWFFNKLRERGRDRTYLKPLDEMVRRMDTLAQTDASMDAINALNTEAIECIRKTMDREQTEFHMRPEYTESEIQPITPELPLTDGN